MDIDLPAAVRHDGYFTLMVVGQRDYDDAYELDDALDRFYDAAEQRGLRLELLRGDMMGASTIAGDWAASRHVTCHSEHVDQDDPRREERLRAILARYQPDLCLMVPPSTAASMMADLCRATGIPVVHLDEIRR